MKFLTLILALVLIGVVGDKMIKRSNEEYIHSDTQVLPSKDDITYTIGDSVHVIYGGCLGDQYVRRSFLKK